MSPIDDELRNLLNSRASQLPPAPDPLAGIETRARRMRRNRVLASVIGSAVAVAAIAIAVPTLLSDRDDAVQVATTPTPSASPSASTSAPTDSAALDPAHPWDYRGDRSLITDNELASLRAEWSAKHPGSAAPQPLFGQVYEPSQKPEIVFVAGERWGLATSSEAGWTFPVDEPLAPGTRVLMAALPGDEVPRLLVVAAPSTGQIAYAKDGISFHDLVGPQPGVAFAPLEGNTSQDAVRVLDGDGNLDKPVFQGPAPDPANPAPQAADALPVNLLVWQPRGSTPSPALLEQATAAFATGLSAPRADVSARVLYAGRDKAGQDYVFIQAWVKGQKAHTAGFISDGKGGGQPFLGPAIGREPSLLAFDVPSAQYETLVLLPRPGAGRVLYAPTSTAAFQTVANGRSDLNPVGLVDRNPRTASDRVEVHAGDDSVLLRSRVQPLLCGLWECG